MHQEKKLFPYFQPIIGAASGTIIGYEALARQHDAAGRVISAGELFSSPDIPADQLIAWDRMVRRQALERFSQSNYNGYLTINISAAWIDKVSDLNALPTIMMLNEFNIDRSRIIIEITESKGDLDKLVEIAAVYRGHGLKIAIDDFGAGFSQLERVMAIQPDIIKLDMQLFQNATRGGIASDIVHLLSRLAKRTGCRIVCEGVETDEDFHFGLSCGAQYMQGYLFSPAMPEFKEPKHYQQQISSLRKTFLKKTLAKEEHKIQFISNIKGLIDLLKIALESDFNLNKLSAHPFEQSGVLRFYLCNNDGDQISSNFNFADGKWFEDTTQLGFNWAWRPYFYQLLALESAKDSYRIVTSERYRDFNTDMLCKTLSLRLDEERILLIDIAAEWL
ncbi:EAL domain-containing protein [Methylobacter sp. Wu8]|uniref:EAL domain-containing protein (Putative c-di-GMP-specific phosphodiesterase class I) n=1 Tax=Methylobacter tundripaludum TaxID=173365 RepID=A0A2S6H2T9_9GAMM|nr:EAL domain-containing protein [Methylobacter tundripaludum]MCK9635640.1 EAL domain-containing protein [Methylobacter tundripaludum]PPK71726.1 EAL domain-containing protein (putative c-di-GMP-specific phosphodiesterase class I) [Methylobacter tundripaludum]